MRAREELIESAIIAILRTGGGAMALRDLIRELEASEKPTEEDLKPQKGREYETRFSYRCRWAISGLRNRGIIRRPWESGRGIIELSAEWKHYGMSCGELLEQVVAERFADGEEHSRDEILSWFASHYPLFSPSVVQRHIEDYTTNCRSRDRHFASPGHDLLFRVEDDWTRLRLYRPGEDPTPAPSKPDARKSSKATASTKARQVSLVEQNRRVLAHLATFGELAPADYSDLRLDEDHLADWLDALLVRRPEAHVVTPLFLHLIEEDASPSAFTTRLAAHFIGEHLRRHAPDPIPELEEHVWTRFGRWHLMHPDSGDQKMRAYLKVPMYEPRDGGASERLDLFAQLPPQVIRSLIRDPEFLSEQQTWSSDAASRLSEGSLSTQLRRDWRRPLMLSTTELLVNDAGHVLVGEMTRADVMVRNYIVAGLPLCTPGELEPAGTLEREAAAERLIQHPVAAALLQFEIHQLFAGLSGDPAALIRVGAGATQLELNGASRGPLWRYVRSMLEQSGYRPVGASIQAKLWADAVDMMLKNLELLNVFERDGDVLRLTDDYQSKIKAHPGHPQNRGEKPYRVRLSQFLAALHGGQA